MFCKNTKVQTDDKIFMEYEHDDMIKLLMILTSIAL